MEVLFAEIVKQLGVPGAIMVTLAFCTFLTTRSSANRSDAESKAIETNANMASVSQAEAFKAKDLLQAATERLGKLETRVSQLEDEGKHKDDIIAKLRAELNEVQQTVEILQERLRVERTEKEAMAQRHAREIDVLTKQIDLLRKRMEKLDKAELEALAKEVAALNAATPEPVTETHKELP